MELLYIQPTLILFSVHSSLSLFFSLSCALCVTLQPALSSLITLSLFKMEKAENTENVEATDLLQNNLRCYDEDCLDPARYVKLLSTPLCEDFFLFFHIIVIYLLLHYDVCILQGHLEVIKSFHTFLCWSMCTCAHTCVHTHVRADMCAQTHAFTHSYTCTHSVTYSQKVQSPGYFHSTSGMHSVSMEIYF